MQDLARFAFIRRSIRHMLRSEPEKHESRVSWNLMSIVLLVSTSFCLVRFVSLPFLITAWVFFVRYGRNRLRPSLIAWTFWLMLSISPVDVVPARKGGPPRLVPLVMGLPTRETAERAKRGEVILGGCIASGLEPKYYLVW